MRDLDARKGTFKFDLVRAAFSRGKRVRAPASLGQFAKHEICVAKAVGKKQSRMNPLHTRAAVLCQLSTAPIQKRPYT